jgi:hypothetical protein
MSKIYEADDTVVYKNEDGDLWIKDRESGERTYIPADSDEPAGVFDGHHQIDIDSDNEDDEED